MALKANYEFLFFGKDENSFLENYSYDLFQNFGEKSGQIFINLEIQNNPVDAEEIGSVIFETMQKVFFEDVEKDPYARFETSLKAVNSVLNEFKSQKVSKYIGNLNVVIAAIAGNKLYLSQTGDCEAYLLRKRYVSIISEGLSEEGSENEDIFSSIASGDIEEGDFVLFSSTRLLRYISKTDLAKTLNRGSILETLNEIKDVVSTEILGRIGLTGILFAEATKEDLEELKDEENTANMSILESTNEHVVKEKESLTGRFFTALKNRRKFKEGRNIGGSIKFFFESIGSVIKRFFDGLFAKGFGRDKILALLVLVIIILIVGIFIANSQNAAQEEIQRLDETLSNVQQQILEAKTKREYDKESARQILDKAYQDAMTVLNSGYYRDKAKTFLIQIDEARDTLDYVKRIDNPKILADLSKKRSDINALGFATLKDRVFVYEYNALYEVVVDQVQDPFTINDTEVVIAATGFDEKNSIVFLTKSGKLIEYKDGTMSFMDTEEGAFHKAIDIEDWSNKIYLLDPTGSQLWKYTYKGTREKFGNAEPYFATAPDLSNAESFAIDSSIYLLKNNGDISKFYAGNVAEFYINNPPFTDLNNPTKIYTDDKLDYVFVLDSAEGRILLYRKDSKTGNLVYESQYLIEGAGELRDIYADPDSKKLYVLTPSKILEVDM